MASTPLRLSHREDFLGSRVGTEAVSKLNNYSIILLTEYPLGIFEHSASQQQLVRPKGQRTGTTKNSRFC